MEKIVRSIVSQINQKIEIQPEIAIVLGSGLSDIVDCMDKKIIIPYNELEGMPQTKVEGHKNQFIVGKLAGNIFVNHTWGYRGYGILCKVPEDIIEWQLIFFWSCLLKTLYYLSLPI